MTHTRLFGLFIVAAALSTAAMGAGSAAGTVLCTAQETPCKKENKISAGTVLDFRLKSGTKAKLVTTGGEVLNECSKSTVKVQIEKDETVTGPIEALTWSECTSGATTTLTLGKLEIQNIAGTHNGTVLVDAEVGVTFVSGVYGSCVYGAKSGTDIGELKEGNPASFAANAVAVKLSGSAFACPETAKWTAQYTSFEPSERTIAVEPGSVGEPSVLCTTQESPCPEASRWATGTTLDFSLKSGTSALLTETGGSTLDTCTGSTAKGKLEKAEAVTGPLESLTWTGCTFTTTTTKLGSFEVAHIAGSHNGTVRADGEIGVTIDTVFFGSCIYGLKAGADLGTLTEGKPATFDANAVAVKLTGSAFACPETSKWTATYTLTEPSEKTLAVETT